MTPLLHPTHFCGFMNLDNERQLSNLSELFKKYIHTPSKETFFTGICCKEKGDSVVLLYFCRPPLTRSNLWVGMQV